MILLGITGGVIVLCIGVALVFFVARMAMNTLGSSTSTFASVGTVVTTKAPAGTPANVQARQAAEAFMQTLMAGRVDEAHGMASQDFQRAVENVNLRAQYEGTPQLRRGNLQLVLLKQGPEVVYFSGTVTGPNGSVAFKMRVIKEDFEWKVGEFNLNQ
jgi:hypothetical protein